MTFAEAAMQNADAKARRSSFFISGKAVFIRPVSKIGNSDQLRGQTPLFVIFGKRKLKITIMKTNQDYKNEAQAAFYKELKARKAAE